MAAAAADSDPKAEVPAETRAQLSPGLEVTLQTLARECSICFHFIHISLWFLSPTQASFTPLRLAFCTSKGTEGLSVICCFYLHPFNPHSGRVIKLWGERDALHVSIPLWQIFHLLLYLVILSNNRNWNFTSWNTVAETFEMFLLEGAASIYVLSPTASFSPNSVLISCYTAWWTWSVVLIYIQSRRKTSKLNDESNNTSIAEYTHALSLLLQWAQILFH